jgi:two-component system cell cycle response regulator DivK
MQKTVLIVEDDPSNRKYFRDVLENEGHKILEADNGLTALALCQEHTPDLVLMDIQLPELSGYHATKRIKECAELASIPIVVVTAFAMNEDKERFRDSGYDGYLTKPVSVKYLIHTVNSHLN